MAARGFIASLLEPIASDLATGAAYRQNGAQTFLPGMTPGEPARLARFPAAQRWLGARTGRSWPIVSSGEEDRCTQRAPSRGDADTCPRCGAPGRVVAEETVAAILRSADAALLAEAETRFCATRDCPVVYYTRDGRVAEKAAAVIRIGAKEKRDPVPLCYCFGFSRADVYREVESTGTSTIPDRIEAEIRAGRCACRRKNPSGACCLGEVREAVSEAGRRRSRQETQR